MKKNSLQQMAIRTGAVVKSRAGNTFNTGRSKSRPAGKHTGKPVNQTKSDVGKVQKDVEKLSATTAFDEWQKNEAELNAAVNNLQDQVAGIKQHLASIESLNAAYDTTKARITELQAQVGQTQLDVVTPIANIGNLRTKTQQLVNDLEDQIAKIKSEYNGIPKEWEFEFQRNGRRDITKIIATAR